MTYAALTCWYFHAGPSVAELFDTVQSYGPMRRQSRIESEPSLSAEAAALDEKKWVTLTVAKIKQKFRGKVMTKDDQELYRGIVASGVLDLEPALAKEMSQMMERAEVILARSRFPKRWTDHA